MKEMRKLFAGILAFMICLAAFNPAIASERSVRLTVSGCGA